ncbi:hypothetical protein EZS27_015675 [termite gut metagenome]|uniref:Phage integrase SAM-like domain-containing protein n=1 Tax=termite gut metagenome TaxID=433724 RepID=A0A5J4RSN1_9ZZZZ
MNQGSPYECNNTGKRGKLYLDIYEKGQRKWESLHLDLSDDKELNREIWRLAEICRAKRNLQMVSGDWGLIDPIGGRKTLYHFIESLAKGRGPSDRFVCVLRHLKRFPGGTTIQIGQINEKWVADFQSYLLKSLAQNTAHFYAGAIQQVLNQAVLDNIIAKNPGAPMLSQSSCGKRIWYFSILTK